MWWHQVAECQDSHFHTGQGWLISLKTPMHAPWSAHVEYDICHFWQAISHKHVQVPKRVFCVERVIQTMSGYAPLLFRASSSFQLRPVCLSGISRCIMKMAKMCLHEVLLQPLPLPISVGIYPPVSSPSLPTSACEDHHIYQTLHASDEQRTLKIYVSVLSEKLCMYYPKQIEWLGEQPPPYV
jgi:hypothetical protein